MSNKVLAQILAGCVLLLIATLLLLYEAQSGVGQMANQEHAASLSTWSTFDRQQQCVRNEIYRKVPKGDAVFVSPNQSGFDAGQLVELSSPWARPVESRVQAKFSLRMVAGAQCDGESVLVARLR